MCKITNFLQNDLSKYLKNAKITFCQNTSHHPIKTLQKNVCQYFKRVHKKSFNQSICPKYTSVKLEAKEFINKILCQYLKNRQE